MLAKIYFVALDTGKGKEIVYVRQNDLQNICDMRADIAQYIYYLLNNEEKQENRKK